MSRGGRGVKLGDDLAMPCRQIVIPEVSNWLFAHFVAKACVSKLSGDMATLVVSC